MTASGWIDSYIDALVRRCVAAHESILVEVCGGRHVDVARLADTGFFLHWIEPGKIAKTTSADVQQARHIFHGRLQDVRTWRMRLLASQGRDGIYRVNEPGDDPFEAVLLHHEVDQTIHSMGLRLVPEDSLAQNIAGAMYVFARESVFAVGAKLVGEFAHAVLERDRVPDRSCLHAVLTLAHHTPRHPEVHSIFKKALEKVAARDPAAWLFFLRFEDFLANHRLSGKRQILGTFAVKTKDGVAFDPPLEDWNLANKLRKRFGLVDVETFLREEEQRLAWSAGWANAEGKGALP